MQMLFILYWSLIVVTIVALWFGSNMYRMTSRAHSSDKFCVFFFQVSVVSIRIGFASFATLDYNASRLFPELLRVSCSLRTAIIHQQSWHKRSEKQYLERNCPAVNWREGGMCEARRAGELMSGFRGPSARQGRSMRPLQGAGRRLRDRRLRRVPLTAWPS